GPRFLRVLPDVYADARDAPPDLLLLRSLAGYRLVEGRGVLSGWSAALVLDADCAPHPGVPAEVTVPSGGQRAHPGLLVRRDRLSLIESCRVGDVVAEPLPWTADVCCTTPLHTAYDLGRRGDLVDRVVAVDRLANRHRFAPDLLLHVGASHRGGRGSDVINETLVWTSPYSGSPMETRLRLLIERAGLPRPAVQWVVQDPVTRTAVWLDLAWPDHMIGIEYEGEVHADAAAVRRDTARFTSLVAAGWRVFRYTKDDIRNAPDRIVAELTRARQHAR
ncbi:MAG: endonuclease domain-containing protein, partial [Pseudonocardia sp.]|nr:endonuclease domain-containing protein [Pseudonocardia sp.]